jgi:Anti-sigma-K factor rskA
VNGRDPAPAADPRHAAVVALLDEPSTWAIVTPDLRDRVVTAALAPAMGDGRTGVGLGRTPRHPMRPQAAGRHRRRSRRPAALVAAAVVAVACLAGGVRLAGDDPTPVRAEVALAGTEAAPGATAIARLRDVPAGTAVTLDTSGLEPAPPGSFYEAWLVGDAGKVSAGTFHLRGHQAEIELWLGVDPDGYDAVTVTRQPVAGGTTAEGVVVLRGDLPHR